MDPDSVRPPSPLRVLLVDDQRLTGLVLQRLLLSESDIEVHCCQVPSDALGQAKTLRPSLILQDLVMPDADGLDMVRMFGADAATSDIPVIVLSGDDDAETRGRAFSAGAVDYMVKMPSKRDLIACLRRHARPDSVAPQPSGS